KPPAGVALMCVCAMATTSRTTTTTRPSNPVTTRRSWCLPIPQICSRNSPKVCGRTPEGQCQRFNSICELGLANALRSPANVRHTRDLDCKGVRGVGPAHRRRCWAPCPPRPVVCKQSHAETHICVQSRDRRQCKVLANNCQLRNQNCHSQPRNNWRRTDKRRCGRLQLGDKPQACTSIPRPRTTRRPTHRPTQRP
ncbi:hypothetical protein KR018_004416, partial [Drosophila ironensis]